MLIEIVERSAVAAADFGRGCGPDSGHAALPIFWSVVVVLRLRGIVHCHVFLTPDHNRSTVAVWCGTGAGSGSARSTGPPGSGRSQESGQAVSMPGVSCSPATDPLVLAGAADVRHPAARSSVRRVAGRRLR